MDESEAGIAPHDQRSCRVCAHPLAPRDVGATSAPEHDVLWTCTNSECVTNGDPFWAPSPT